MKYFDILVQELPWRQKSGGPSETTSGRVRRNPERSADVTSMSRDLDVTSACNRISLRRRHHRHLSLQRTLTRRKFDD